MAYAKRPEYSVLIASPSTAFRLRLRQVLTDMCVAHHVADRGEMERLLAKLRPAVLFIDLALPHFDMLKGLRAIQRLSPSTKTILLTTKPDLTEELLALKAGVHGYCHRDVDPLLMTKAVEMVKKGEFWVERGVIPHLVRLAFPSPMQEKERLKHLTVLTVRQREIATLVSSAASNKEIAIALNISESAVKSHLTTIFRKLGISARLALALMIRENPYVSPPNALTEQPARTLLIK